MTGISLRTKIEQAGKWDLLIQTCREHKLSPDTLLGRCRTRAFVRARHAYWSALHREGMSCFAIGKMLCVDHSSVIYALGKPVNNLERKP